MKNDTNNILVDLSVIEKKVALLYEEYARKFPESRKIFAEIAVQEHDHEEILLDLHYRIEEEKIRLEANEHLPNMIEYIRKHLDEWLVSDKIDGISRKKALENALRIEQSMLESDCFEMVDSNSPRVKKVFDQLKKEAHEHFEKFQKEMETLKEQ